MLLNALHRVTRRTPKTNSTLEHCGQTVAVPVHRRRDTAMSAWARAGADDPRLLLNYTVVQTLRDDAVQVSSTQTYSPAESKGLQAALRDPLPDRRLGDGKRPRKFLSR